MDRPAVRLTISTFGAVAALAGMEHGIGEVRQGNRAPEAVMFRSWPETGFFEVLDGEPAMSLIPNLLVSGIVSIAVSLAMLVWTTMFIDRRHGGLLLLGISGVLLLVGGGFGPPMLGALLGLAATRFGTETRWWRRDAPGRVQRALGAAWPWSLGAALVAWFSLMPGTLVVDAAVGLPQPDLTVAVIGGAAFALLGLAIGSAFAHDATPRRDAGVQTQAGGAVHGHA